MGYASQLKLFRVFFQGRDHFFQSKMAAKKFGHIKGLKGVVVHRGPDHWREAPANIMGTKKVGFS